MKKWAVLILLGFVLILLMSCVVSRPTIGPPLPKKEIRPVKPGPNFVWISGHWRWTGVKYVWVPGHWTRSRPGRIWIPGHWEKRGPHWVWIKGHWRRR